MDHLVEIISNRAQKSTNCLICTFLQIRFKLNAYFRWVKNKEIKKANQSAVQKKYKNMINKNWDI